MNVFVRVQVDDFSMDAQYQQLTQGKESGAVVTFVGRVRDNNLGAQVSGLTLEHYPQMTEKVLNDICQQALSRWQIEAVRVIHRVGELHVGEQIVFVGVSSKHRKMAFEACEFVMDNLKTKAPFWKKERIGDQSRWLDSREEDLKEQLRWES